MSIKLSGPTKRAPSGWRSTSSFANFRSDSRLLPAQRTSIRRLPPSVQPNTARLFVNSEISAFASKSASGYAISTPIRRMRSACAWTASGQVVAPPRCNPGSCDIMSATGPFTDFGPRSLYLLFIRQRISIGSPVTSEKCPEPTCKERLSYIEPSLTQIAGRSRVALTPAPFGKAPPKARLSGLLHGHRHPLSLALGNSRQSDYGRGEREIPISSAGSRFPSP